MLIDHHWRQAPGWFSGQPRAEKARLLAHWRLIHEKPSERKEAEKKARRAELERRMRRFRG